MPQAHTCTRKKLLQLFTGTLRTLLYNQDMKFDSILGGLLALLAVSLLGPDRLAGGEETSHGLLAKKHPALGLSPITPNKR